MCLNGEISLPLSITHTVVQGSVLGLTLYVLYKADITILSDINKIFLYALIQI